MIADALSRRYTLLSQLDCRIFGLQSIKEQYALDPDFKNVLLNCREGRTWNKFMISDGFLFRANRLCILVGSVRLLLLQEAHGGGLTGHFGEEYGGGAVHTFLLAKNKARCRTVCGLVCHMSKS